MTLTKEQLIELKRAEIIDCDCSIREAKSKMSFLEDEMECAYEDKQRAETELRELLAS